MASPADFDLDAEATRLGVTLGDAPSSGFDLDTAAPSLGVKFAPYQYSPEEAANALSSDPYYEPSRADAEGIYQLWKKDGNAAQRFLGQSLPHFLPALQEFGRTHVAAAGELLQPKNWSRIPATVLEAGRQFATGTAGLAAEGLVGAKDLAADTLGVGGPQGEIDRFHNRLLLAQKARRMQEGLPEFRSGGDQQRTELLGEGALPNAAAVGGMWIPIPGAGQIGVVVGKAAKVAAKVAEKVPGAAKVAEAATVAADKLRAVPQAARDMASGVSESLGAVPKPGAGVAEQGLSTISQGLRGGIKAIRQMPDELAVVREPLRLAAAATVGAVEAPVAAAEKIIEASRRLRALPASQVPDLLRLAKDPAAPTWLRRSASLLHAAGAGTAAEVAADFAKSAASGAAGGYALGMVATDDPKKRAEFAGMGAGQHLIGRGLRKATGRDAANKRLFGQQGDLVSFLAHLKEQGVDDATIANIKDHEAEILAHFALGGPVSSAATFRAAINEGLKIRFMSGPDFAAAHPESPNAGGSHVNNTVTVNLGAPQGPNSVVHELAHNLLKAAGADGQVRIAIDNLLGPKGVAKARQEYAAKIAEDDAPHPSPEQVAAKMAALDARHGGDSWVYSEIYAEAGRKALRRDVVRDVLNPTLLRQVRNLVAGDFFEKTQGSQIPADALFSIADVYGPELRRILNRHLRTVYEKGPGLAQTEVGKEGVPPPVAVPVGMAGKTPALAPDADGFRVINGQLVYDRKTARMQERDRAAAVKATINEQPTKPLGDASPEVAPRVGLDGKNEVAQGTKVADQLEATGQFSRTAVNLARTIESVIGAAQGAVLRLWYNPVGTSAKIPWAADVKARKGNIPASQVDMAFYDFHTSKVGNVLARGLSLTAMERRITEWQAKPSSPLNQLWNGDVASFRADLHTYLQNHANNVSGETSIGTGKKNALNFFIVGRLVRLADVNPLRVEAAKSLVRSLRLDRMASAEQVPGAFPVDWHKQAHNLSPGKKDNERVVAAAWKDKRGRVHTGAFHGEIYDSLGMSPLAGQDNSNIAAGEGFVTDTGRFVDREEAAKLGKRRGQLGKEVGQEAAAEDFNNFESPELSPGGPQPWRLAPEEQKKEGWVGPLYHGSGDFIGDTFDRRYLGRETGLSRGGFNFTKDLKSAKAHAKPADPEQGAIDAANAVMRDVGDWMEKGGKLPEVPDQWKAPDELPEFNWQNVDDPESFRDGLRTYYADRLPEPFKSRLKEAADVTGPAGKPALFQVWVKNPREVKVRDKVSYVADDPSQIVVEKNLQSEAEDLTYGGLNATGYREADKAGRTFVGPHPIDQSKRFEIDDSRMRFRAAGVKRLLNNEVVPLDYVITHDALFNQYPELRKVEVSSSDNLGNSWGAWYRSENRIRLSPKIVGDLDYYGDEEHKLSATRVLLHEVQHAIQDWEGFAKGSSPAYEEVTLRHHLSQIRAYLTANGLSPATEQVAQRALEAAGFPTGVKPAVFHGLMLRLKTNGDTTGLRDWIADQSMVRYVHSAGEFESRDVAHRAHMDERDRQEVSPYSSEFLPKNQLLHSSMGIPFSPTAAEMAPGGRVKKVPEVDPKKVEMYGFGAKPEEFKNRQDSLAKAGHDRRFLAGHRAAVRAAILNGRQVRPEAVDAYPELKWLQDQRDRANRAPRPARVAPPDQPDIPGVVPPEPPAADPFPRAPKAERDHVLSQRTVDAFTGLPTWYNDSKVTDPQSVQDAVSVVPKSSFFRDLAVRLFFHERGDRNPSPGDLRDVWIDMAKNDAQPKYDKAIKTAGALLVEKPTGLNVTLRLAKYPKAIVDSVHAAREVLPVVSDTSTMMTSLSMMRPPGLRIKRSSEGFVVLGAHPEYVYKVLDKSFSLTDLKAASGSPHSPHGLTMDWGTPPHAALTRADRQSRMPGGLPVDILGLTDQGEVILKMPRLERNARPREVDDLMNVVGAVRELNTHKRGGVTIPAAVRDQPTWRDSMGNAYVTGDVRIDYHGEYPNFMVDQAGRTYAIDVAFLPIDKGLIGKTKANQASLMMYDTGWHAQDSILYSPGGEVQDEAFPAEQFRAVSDPAAIRKAQRAANTLAAKFPEAVRPTLKKGKDGEAFVSSSGAAALAKVKYDLASSPLVKRVGASAAASVVGDKLVADYREAFKNPEVAEGLGWYQRVREQLRQTFGENSSQLAQFLAATSARTGVADNFKISVEAMQNFASGRYDDLLKRYADFAEKGGQLKDWKEFPTKKNGAKFNANSRQVFRVMLNLWAEKAGLKTSQFAKNLTGEDLGATIDVWAARTMRRMLYADDQPRWRILLAQETGVAPKDFLFSQSAYADAAKKLGISPDDLQAVLWFAEKDLWQRNGWTQGAGAAKSSFSAEFNKMLGKTEQGELGLDLSAQKPYRMQLGLTTFKDEGSFKPDTFRAAMKGLRQVARKAGGLMSVRSEPTRGYYLGSYEPSFDFEATFNRPKAYDALEEVAYKIGKTAKQNDTLISRLVDADHPNARPGVEIGFRRPLTMARAEAVMRIFNNNGIASFTVAVDHKGRATGIRSQYSPEMSEHVTREAAKAGRDEWSANLQKVLEKLKEYPNLTRYADKVSVSSRVFAAGEDYVRPRGGTPSLDEELARRAVHIEKREAARARDEAAKRAGEGQDQLPAEPAGNP